MGVAVAETSRNETWRTAISPITPCRTLQWRLTIMTAPPFNGLTTPSLRTSSASTPSSGERSTLEYNEGRSNEPLRDIGHRRSASLSTNLADLIETKARSTAPVLGSPFGPLATDGPAARRGAFRREDRY